MPVHRLPAARVEIPVQPLVPVQRAWERPSGVCPFPAPALEFGRRSMRRAVVCVAAAKSGRNAIVIPSELLNSGSYVQKKPIARYEPASGCGSRAGSSRPTSDGLPTSTWVHWNVTDGVRPPPAYVDPAAGRVARLREVHRDARVDVVCPAVDRRLAGDEVDEREADRVEDSHVVVLLAGVPESPWGERANVVVRRAVRLQLRGPYGERGLVDGCAARLVRDVVGDRGVPISASTGRASADGPRQRSSASCRPRLRRSGTSPALSPPSR